MPNSNIAQHILSLKRHIGLLLAASVFIVQAFLIRFVGASWDEPASFFVGQANVKFWETGNRDYLNHLDNKALFAGSPIQYIYGEDIYPPFPFTVGGIFSRIFSERLGWIGVFDGYHLGEVFLGAIGVYAMYGLSIGAGLPPFAALLVTPTYALYPSVWGPMRNDAKDVPLVSMLILSAYLFLLWIKSFKSRPGWKNPVYGLAFAIVLGLSGATKPTAAIFVIIASLWIWISTLLSSSFRDRLPPAKLFAGILSVMAVVSLGSFLFAWPWLWEDPIEKLVRVFTFFKSVGYNMPTPFFGTIYRAAVTLPTTYAVTILAIQTPIEITLLAVIGLCSAIYQFVVKRKVIPGFFAIWFVIGMGRFFIPGVIIYSWVRHFIDAMPAFFILAGYGALWVSNIVERRFSVQRRFTLLGIASMIAIHQIIISIQFFPYEMSYFNFLVGGTKTVSEKWYFDVGQGAGTREAMEFIAKDSAGKPVNVYPCLMGHLARFYASDNVTLVAAPEYGNYTIVPNSPSWFEGALTFGKYNHDRVYTVKRSGADLFYVYKYTKPYGWRCGWETKSNYDWQ